MSNQYKEQKIILFGIPKDKDIQAAFGVLTIRHGQLDYALRMTIRTFANLSIEEALDATNRDGSNTLREIIKKLARQKLGEGEALLKIRAILERAKRVTDKRNEYVHSLWGLELDGPAMIKQNDHSWKPVPSANELEKLADDIYDIAQELNEARSYGFIAKALENTAKLIKQE